MKSKKKPVVIREAKRQPGYFKIQLGEKEYSPLTKEEFLDRYFIKLDKNLNKDTDLNKLLKQYESVWKKLGHIYYIDSWGHLWEQGPSDRVMLEYLQNKQNEIT